MIVPRVDEELDVRVDRRKEQEVKEPDMISRVDVKAVAKL